MVTFSQDELKNYSDDNVGIDYCEMMIKVFQSPNRDDILEFMILAFKDGQSMGSCLRGVMYYC